MPRHRRKGPEGPLVPAFYPQAQRQQSAEQPSGSVLLPSSSLNRSTPIHAWLSTRRCHLSRMPTLSSELAELPSFCRRSAIPTANGSTRKHSTLSDALHPAARHVPPGASCEDYAAARPLCPTAEPSFDRRTLRLGLDPAMAMRKICRPCLEHGDVPRRAPQLARGARMSPVRGDFSYQLREPPSGAGSPPARHDPGAY